LRRRSPPLGLERSYEVRVDPGRRGEVVAIDFGRPAGRGRTPRGERCWRLFEGREAPCAGCGVFDEKAPAELVCVLREGGAAFRVVCATRKRTRARVWVFSLSTELPAKLLLESLRRSGERAGLSRRESSVFQRLARGWRTVEIAADLGITPRTAKFHMANLHRKLGTRSGLDVLRLVLQGEAAQEAGPPSRGSRRAR
jgi:DNA-binding CsgD family transcriptional regulator